MCQALTQQAKEYRTSGEEAGSTDGSKASLPILPCHHFSNEETRKLLVWFLLFLAMPAVSPLHSHEGKELAISESLLS